MKFYTHRTFIAIVVKQEILQMFTWLVVPVTRRSYEIDHLDKYRGLNFRWRFFDMSHFTKCKNRFYKEIMVFDEHWQARGTMGTTGVVLAIGESLASSSLQTASKVKCAADWSTSWRPPGSDRLSLRWPEWILAYGHAVDAINIVLVSLSLLLLVLLLCPLPKYMKLGPSRHPHQLSDYKLCLEVHICDCILNQTDRKFRE